MGARQGAGLGEVWRGSGLRRLSALGREGGPVSSFLPEVKFPKLVADRTQATHPYLGEGAERAVFHFTLSIPVNSPSQQETFQLWLSDLLPQPSLSPHPLCQLLGQKTQRRNPVLFPVLLVTRGHRSDESLFSVWLPSLFPPPLHLSPRPGLLKGKEIGRTIWEIIP